MQVHRKPIREQKLPKRLEDFVTLIEFANIMNSLEDLVTFTEALAKDDIQKWKAITEEDMVFWQKTTHGYYQSFQQITKVLVACECFELKGMIMVKLYTIMWD